MRTITKKMIEHNLVLLNKYVGVEYPYQYEKRGDTVLLKRDAENRLIQNAGHYSLQGCNGAFKIERTCEHGSDDVTPLGTKREVYNQVRAMIEGIETYRNVLSKTFNCSVTVKGESI
tara:strand:- start:284 stop:634 length:351 start_codon:yes stop_codon:yes gene_type:complete